MAELVDALGLGSSEATRGGSIPSARTTLFSQHTVFYGKKMNALENFSISEKSEHERELTITVPADIVSKEFGLLLKKVQQSASKPGFRPGKLPTHMVKNLYQQKISQEVIENLIDKTLSPACKEGNLIPVSKPRFEPVGEFSETQAFTYKATFQVKPKLDIKNYENLSIETTNFTFDESDIDHEISMLRENYATFMLPKDRTEVCDSDLVGGALTMQIDGEFNDEFNNPDYSIALYNKDLPAHMKAALLGKAIGDEVIMDYEFPSNHHHEHTESCSHEHEEKRMAKMFFTIKSLKERVLPNIDDEFAKDLSDKFTTLEQLKDTIRTKLSMNKKQNDFLQKKYAITNALINANPFNVPPALLETVAMSIVNEMINHESSKKLSKNQIESVLKDNWHEIWPLAQERALFQTKSELIYENLIEKLAIDFDKEALGKLVKNNSKINLKDAEFSAKVDNLLKLIEEKSQISVVDKSLLNKGN